MCSNIVLTRRVGTSSDLKLPFGPANDDTVFFARLFANLDNGSLSNEADFSKSINMDRRHSEGLTSFHWITLHQAHSVCQVAFIGSSRRSPNRLVSRNAQPVVGFVCYSWYERSPPRQSEFAASAVHLDVVIISQESPIPPPFRQAFVSQRRDGSNPLGCGMFGADGCE